MRNYITAEVTLGKSSKKALVILGLALSFVAHASDKVVPIQEVFEPSGQFPKSRFVKVAVVQVAPVTVQVGVNKATAERLKQRNREILKGYIETAAEKGAEIIVTPEMGVVGYPDIPDLPDEDDNFRSRADIEPYLEEVRGPQATSAIFFGGLARRLGVYIQYGIAEVDPSTKRIYNTAVAVNPQGEVIASHRKVSLFKLEQNYFSAGTRANSYDTPAGKFGMLICADVYNHTLLANYRKQGVQALALSTSWAQMNTGMGYFKAAAQRVRAYLLAANHPYFPDSGVVRPDGTTQSHIRQSNGVAFGFLPRL